MVFCLLLILILISYMDVSPPNLQDLYKRGRDWALPGNKARLASQHFYVNAYDPDRYGDYVHCIYK